MVSESQASLSRPLHAELTNEICLLQVNEAKLVMLVSSSFPISVYGRRVPIDSSSLSSK